MIMNRGTIPEAFPLGQGSLNSTTHHSFLWMFQPFQDGMYPSPADHVSFPNESRAFQSADNRMHFASQTVPTRYPESNNSYIKYFFNLQAQLYTEPNTDMESRAGPTRPFVPYADDTTGSNVMGYLNDRLQMLYDPKCRRNPTSSQAERDVLREAMDKREGVKRREDLGTLETSWDIVWQLNQRRPSVIRRSISNDAFAPSREAVLTTSSTSRPFSPPPSPSSTEYPHESNWSSRELSSDEDVEVDRTRSFSPNVNETDAVEASVTNNNNNAADSGKPGEKWKFYCSFCKKRFQWFSHWQAHERIHTGERPFTCQHCGRSFTRADGLHCHVQTHFKKKVHKCSTCLKTFTKKTCLERHVLDHTGVKPFACSCCNKQFNDVESIETHLMNQTGEVKRFKCQYCNYAFINARRLVRHIRGHTGEKPFKCQQCKMAFSKKSALVIHQRVHTGIKPYLCPVCGKSFSISGNLQRHILIHTGERPYKCLKCQRAFNNPSHLSRHITSQHTK